ncbi:MAG: hypothetical protein QOJ49_1439 [Actinomycetota bacterium]|jgi:uncharacterized damage-inducible protein DinB|nr:hypothetical protein [Actinomycetota bacterium]
MDRTDPPLRADEATTLRAFLDYHRDTLRWKCSGLTQEQLAQSLAPSDMTLGGMMKHLAVVESGWFEETFAGGTQMPPFDTVDWDADRDWEWHTAKDDTPEQLLALFDEACRRADAVLDQALAGPGLDAESVTKDRREGTPFSLRWIVVHMIEEYARHNGHADLIRQSIDGETGE